MKQLLPDNIVGFHVEPTNICTLKCSGCARTQFIDQWPQHWKNYSLDVDVLLNFLDIDLDNKIFSLCGTYGDPIYHPDFLNFVQKLKQQNAVVSIVTNGSYKSQQWWLKLVALLDHRDTVTFSVDGLPENFTQYRVNANWQSIETGMRVCSDSSCKTVWKYIPFSYNENQIDQARELSNSLGLDDFWLDSSSRFDQHTQHLMPGEELINVEFYKQQQWKNGEIQSVVPKCFNNKHHYISADGFYMPCCYISDHRFFYKTMFGKNKNKFDLRNNRLSQILADAEVVDFYQTLQNHPVCQHSCAG